MNYVTLAQVVIAGGLVCYGVAAAVQQVRAASRPGSAKAPLSDLRLVIDLAARLRNQGKSDAVAVCQRLVDELLKPEAPKS